MNTVAMSTEQAERLALIRATCPDWCEVDHTPAATWTVPEPDYAHGKDFGDVHGAHVTAYAAIDLTGQLVSTMFAFDLIDAETLEDMDEITGWCRDAAAFIRQVRIDGGLEV